MRELQDRRNKTRKGHRDPAARWTTVIIKDTPADICQNCGEYYLDVAVTRRYTDRLRKPSGAVRKWKSSAMPREGEPLEEKMRRLVARLREPHDEARRPDEALARNLKELGYDA
ncbi:MAG: type II toxin-antitoxin system MqsA family antitoxin [Gammaproteobacteria bacterium]